MNGENETPGGVYGRTKKDGKNLKKGVDKREKIVYNK